MRTSFTPTARRPIMRGPPRQSVEARTKQMPAPIQGWNGRDALALMQPTDAILMDNWVPGLIHVETRPGYTSFSTGVGSGDVGTILEYHAGSTRQMITAGGGQVYNSTSLGAATSLGSGFSNDRWQGVNMNAKLGMVNGADAPQEWDGTTLSAMTVSGPTIASLLGVYVYRSRSYFWENASQSFWYSETNALGGTLTEFNLSRVGNFGGNVINIMSWNIRGEGSTATDVGFDDVLVIVMSSGDVIVYSGSDPGSDFALVGVYRLGEALDVRGAKRIAGEMVALTTVGYIGMSDMVRGGSPKPISDRIREPALRALDVYQANTGWQVEYYPLKNWLIINVPLGTSEFEQHIQNTLTGAWWRCKDIHARSWGMFNEDIYFGLGDGVVYKWNDGVTDNGSAIECDCRQARDAFDTPQLKQAVGIRPVLKGGPTINFSIVAEPEYNAVVPASKTIYGWTVAAAGDTWDEAEDTFDASEIVFSAAEATGARWLTAIGTGHVFGCRMQTSTSTKIEWLSTWFAMKPGVGI